MSLRLKDYILGNIKGADVQSAIANQGGFALPKTISDGILLVQGELSPMRSICNVVSASSEDHYAMVSTGAAAGGFVSEIDTRPTTNTPEVAKRQAKFGEIYARPQAFQQVLEDTSFDCDAWLSANIAKTFSQIEGTSFLSGTGSDQPLGMLNGLDLSASSASNQVLGDYQVVNSGVDGSFGATPADAVNYLMSLVDALGTEYLGRAVFMMNRATYRSISKLVGSDGAYMLNSELSAPLSPSLLGHPVIFNEDMGGIPTATGDKAPIIFGDMFNAYSVVDLQDTTITRDAYSVKGSVLFYSRKRIGGMVMDAKAAVIGAVSKA
jgi:HK97 family phage major capsid protein